VALSDDGQLAASGSQDGTVKLWETSSGRLLVTLPGHAGGVWGVALSGDGSLVTSGSFDGAVRLWDAESGQLVRTLEGHTSGVLGVSPCRSAATVNWW
jgi:WD40 repeat protein